MHYDIIETQDSNLSSNIVGKIQDIYEAQKSGFLEKNDYVLLKSKNWRMSKKFLEECTEYEYKKAIPFLSNRTLLIQGLNDKNVDRDYNKKFSREYNILYKEYDSTHSLHDVIDSVILDIINFYNNY